MRETSHKRHLFYDSMHIKFKNKQKQSKVFKVIIVVTFAEGGWVVSGEKHRRASASGVQVTWFLIWVPVQWVCSDCGNSVS